MSDASASGERIAVSAVLLVVPLVLLAVSGGDEFTALAAFSPMFFPRGVLWGWAGMAALSLAMDLVARRRRAARDTLAEPGTDAAAAHVAPSVVASAEPLAAPAAASLPAMPEANSRTWLRIALIVGAMAGFVFCVTRLGFLLSAIGFTVAALLILGTRSIVTVVVYGIAMPGALFVLFHHLLGLPLPTSPFSYLF